MQSKSDNFLKIVLASALMVTSPLALAASEKMPWMTYLFIGLTISLVVASILSIRNKSAESLAIKLLLGGVYFWVITFIQLMVFSAIYYFNS